jgi:hypothetical protein
MLRSKLPGLALTLMISLLLVGSSAQAALLPFTQFDLNQINRSQNYRDPETQGICVPTSPITSQASSLEQGSSIYILGDSITLAASSKITTTLEAEPHGFFVSSINADGGRAIISDTYPGEVNGPAPTGLEAVLNDSPIIASSDSIVVALGTNSGSEDLSVQVPAQIKAIRDTGFSKSIYWVDLFSGDSIETRNGAITTASEGVFTIIKASAAGIELKDDRTHPTAAGEQQFADVILQGLLSAQTAGELEQAANNGLCACSATSSSIGSLNTGITWGEGVWANGSEIYQSGLPGPVYTIEEWAIHVLRNIARKSGLPEGDMVTQKKVISMVAWAKAEGGGVDGHVGTFNPLNTKGGSGSELGGSNQGNASTDSNSNGFPTFDKGVEGITRGLFNTLQKRIGSYIIKPDAEFVAEEFIEAVAGNFYSTDGSKEGVVNGLEAEFPGDRIFAAASANGLVYDPKNNGVGNREKYVKTKIGTLNSVRENYADYAGKMLESPRKTTPPGTPNPLVFSPDGPLGGTYTGGSCQQAGGGGSVNSEGYSFPLEAAKKSDVSGVSINQTETTHLDPPIGPTAAFDLLPKKENAAVYSIYRGTPIISTDEDGVKGCVAIQFKAADGFFYWYGHLKNPAVESGVEVDAGVKLAEVADESYGEACIGGTPHLHIDRGCTIDGVAQGGGYDDCRDPDFIPLLSKLYGELPD